MATVINKGGTDKTVILAVREFVAQPFQAPEWRDLRVGWLLSITKNDNDDDPVSDLHEDIGSLPSPGLNDYERVRIGVTDRAAGTVFLGYTNRGHVLRSGLTEGISKLVSSDAGIGTTTTNFWRPKNSASDNNYSVQISDHGQPVVNATDGAQIHFAQNVVGAGGYATLLMMRLQRDNTTTHAKRITLTVKQGTHSSDVLFTNTPTEALLRTNLQAFPGTVQQLGPVDLSVAPDTILLYWPFHNSRLRIHAMGIYKVS